MALESEHVCAEFPAVITLVEAGLGAAIVPELALPVEAHPGLQSVALPEFGVRHIGAVVTASPRPPPLVIEVLSAFTEQRQTRSRRNSRVRSRSESAISSLRQRTDCY